MPPVDHMRGTTTSGIPVLVRDASGDDVNELVPVGQDEAVHRDRVRDADGEHLRYLVAACDGTVVGFCQLVFEQPPTWPEVKLMPTMNDLQVREDMRSRGIGSFMIVVMEELARRRGFGEVFISTDPNGNERAFALYQRLGYEAMQEEPHLDRWSFTSSDGQLHEGEEWIVDLRKEL
ncbi:GNAT family N-acetyltransferase [Candidatus Latescibacterota bacterium]